MAKEQAAVETKKTTVAEFPPPASNTALAPVEPVESTDGMITSFGGDDEFVEQILERKLYNMDACHEYVVQGWLIKAGKISDGKIGRDGKKQRDFWAYFILLTAPCMAAEKTGSTSLDPKKAYKLVRVEKGAMLLVNVAAELMEIAELACDPKYVTHVQIKPDEKRRISGDRQKWFIKFASGRKAPRAEIAPYTVGQKLARPHPPEVDVVDDDSFNHGHNALGNGAPAPRQLGS